MAVWDIKILWSFMFLLTGAAGQTVNYPAPVCAVKGSTVTLLCTFTPLKTVTRNRAEVRINIITVRWCQNHLICHLTTPTVYNSATVHNNRRYRYLGDKTGNCTLQITDIQTRDEATFRFRMEANYKEGHFTGKSGVNVTVIDGARMKINSFGGDRKLKRGENVTLLCTAICTFHQLGVTWFKDGHALSESGPPTLRLGPLTAKDSGNYTCRLTTNSGTLSLPYRLHVEAEEEEVGRDLSSPPSLDSAPELSLIVGVASGVLLALFTLIIIILCIIKRRRAAAAAAAADQRTVGDEVEQKNADIIYSNVLPPAEQEGGGQRQEASRAVEEVSYASVQFKHKKQAGRRAEEAEDAAVIYSSVVSRG